MYHITLIVSSQRHKKGFNHHMVGNENNSTWHCLFDVIDAINSFYFVEKDESTISDILLWAIFANRKELAEICWLRSENHLCKLIFF